MKSFLPFIMFFLMHAPSAACKVGDGAGQTLPGVPVLEKECDEYFQILLIDDSLFARMRRGGSFPEDCTVKRDDLRYLRVIHYNFDGVVQSGEIVCNKAIAEDLLSIFKELYRRKYQINKMVLIDEYGASDEASMADNNTSSFCCRKINRSSVLSKHALGMAVDINPLNNPCIKYGADGTIVTIEPDTPEARKYAARDTAMPHVISPGDLCYTLFTQHGFSWGGNWKSKKDYQHFQK